VLFWRTAVISVHCSDWLNCTQIVELTSHGVCSAAARICPRPCKWWPEQPPRAFRLEVAAHVCDAGHRTPSVYQVWNLWAFLFRRYGWFSVMGLSSLVILTLIFCLLNGVSDHLCHGLPSWKKFLLLTLFRSQPRIRHLADRQWPSVHYASILRERGHNKVELIAFFIMNIISVWQLRLWSWNKLMEVYALPFLVLVTEMHLAWIKNLAPEIPVGSLRELCGSGLTQRGKMGGQ